MSASWYLRFLNSTRGRLIAFLRRDTHTVEELASELHLTDNAVRAHLAALERDGLVRQSGVRRGSGVGKPAYAYELTPAAEQIFPRPYAAVLGEVLDRLDKQMSNREIEEMMREVGRHLAQRYRSGRGDLRARLATATEALNQLGGLAALDYEVPGMHIQGYDCPLAALVTTHPEACHLAEAFVSEVAGIPVRECCSRGETPRCCFEPVEPTEQP